MEQPKSRKFLVHFAAHPLAGSCKFEQLNSNAL
jgi:hypothetical protein